MIEPTQHSVGPDRYVGAAVNLGLQMDPLTGNRYLYAGANPTGMIDDGHKPMYDECNSEVVPELHARRAEPTGGSWSLLPKLRSLQQFAPA
ncbi:MAG: hypothetical protein WD602_08400 [Actinomycetota bacterium]